MWWADTTSGTLKIRNSSDNAWVELLQLDGTLTLEDGSASTPALAFRDDLNTGIYSSSADTFNVAAGGFERMELGGTTIFNEDGRDVDFRIESDTQANLFYLDAGNSRIILGASSATAGKFAVNDSDGNHIWLIGRSSDDKSAVSFRNNADDAYRGRIEVDQSNGMKFQVAGSERARIDSNGFLLIGTTTQGLATYGDDLTLASSGHTGMTIRAGTTHNSSIFFADGTSGNAQKEGFIEYNHNDSYLAFATTATERIRLDSSGNVGIGTTSPSRKLEITDATFSALRIKNSSTSIANGTNICGIEFEHADSSAAGVCAGINALMADTSTGALHMTFSTGTNVNLYQENMRLDSSGNVGIGTTTIGNKLQVHESGSFAVFAGFSNDTTGSGSSDGLIVGINSDENGVLYHYENNAIIFGTNNSEKMRLTNVGQLLVGTTDNNSCSAKLIVQADSIPSYYANSGGLNVNVTNSNDIHCAEFFQGRYNKRVITHSHSNTGSVTFDVFEQNDSNVGSITGGGSSIAFNTSSDYRLKENIVNITDGITRLKQLIPRRFNWISDSTNTLVDGFIAHEVSPVIPEAVTGEKDALEEDGSIDPQAMDYSKLTPLLTAALQEAIAKIEVLETKVAALEAA